MSRVLCIVGEEQEKHYWNSDESQVEEFGKASWQR
jgi:hypothetical protein